MMRLWPIQKKGTGPVGSSATRKAARQKSRSGHAVIELSLMMPWLFFLFVGALDFGFYSYALISVQNSARVAALKRAALHDNYVQALVDRDIGRAFEEFALRKFLGQLRARLLE